MQSHTVFVYVPDTAALGPLGKPFASVSKKITAAFYDDLSTDSAEYKLLPFFSDAPSSIRINFSSLLQNMDHNNSYMFQWPGVLGENAWQEAAAQLIGFLGNSIQSGVTKFLFLSHGDGGQIVRRAAELLMIYPSIACYCITIGMSLSIKPVRLMPGNTKMWLHYYDTHDLIQHIGSRLLQDQWTADVTRKIEHIYLKAPELAGKKIPPNWRSKEIQVSGADSHNNLLRADAAKIICADVLPTLQTVFFGHYHTLDEVLLKYRDVLPHLNHFIEETHEEIHLIKWNKMGKDWLGNWTKTPTTIISLRNILVRVPEQDIDRIRSFEDIKKLMDTVSVDEEETVDRHPAVNRFYDDIKTNIKVVMKLITEAPQQGRWLSM